MDNPRPLRTTLATAALTLAAAVVLPSVAIAAPAAPDTQTTQATQETQEVSHTGRSTNTGYAGLPHGSKRQKTLVIGLDGAAIAKFGAAGMPNVQSLMNNGMTATSNLFANPMAPTVSGAGWSSIATGVWPDKHKVVDNNFTAPNYSQYPDYLSRLESAQPQASTLVVGTWSPIPQTVFGQKVDLRLAGGNDAGTTAKAVDYLATGNPDSTFIHLDEVDGAGHSYGTERPEYLAALRSVDGQVGEILNAVKNRPSYKSEDWLVVLTADHGHTAAGGHGGSSPAERQTFVIAQGKGIKPGTVRNDIKITDIAPTVLKHEGVTAEAAWNLDGKAFSEIEADAFDSLRESLRTRADETAPAADVKGWTTTAPAGWTIDNSAMPAGGVTEWRGWSFATDEFWTNTDRNQGRETSVRNRNVFAVADSDEWDDKAHAPGQFDSTLISPDIKVKGGKTATLSFASNYRIDGPQSGEVFVSYDGGAPQLVKAYSANFNGFESLALDVPKGAKKAKVSFRYTGTNSAFWTVDQVTLDR
ncbi:alkaline phosphatase family protein [Arthrobacter sp. yr096]|uniref:alkaline phosphatase family protein n=1 Tax=Arthrobacter sp. yr096 TaxID=1761750 RepID=UPI00210B1442|nr:alkaline phosphatase family protein [Arthrobacter sp. yr096]